MIVLLLVVAGLCVWLGAALIIEGFQRARRPDGTERLMRLRATSLADEAQEWLDRHG